MARWLAALCMWFALSAPAAARDLSAAFEIVWKGQAIGYHIVNVEESAAGLRIDTRVEMRVKFGPISLYRFAHECREIWRGGELYAIRSETDDNGDEMSLRAWREEGVLMVDGDAYRGPAPAGARPANWWNKAVLGARTLINPQNGEIIEVEVENFGRGPAPYGRVAEHYRLTGTLAVDLWFDGERWVGSHAVIDGEELTYRPIEESDERQRLFAMLD